MIRSIFAIVGVLGFSGVLLVQNTSASCSMGKMDHSHMAMNSTPSTVVAKVQTKCPVMGADVDTAQYAVWQGDTTHAAKKVYFCCPMCKEKFNANQVKYIHKLENMKQPIEDAKI